MRTFRASTQKNVFDHIKKIKLKLNYLQGRPIFCSFGGLRDLLKEDLVKLAKLRIFAQTAPVTKRWSLTSLNQFYYGGRSFSHLMG